ncbi:MAG: hypothetical protein ABJF10_01120 [Chthoniobacter sp.]|uniref:hypothetical protein n=1 Tax=Chthoniobacter sp. TaxID=2510640 RepID=UPI0032A782ED
MLTKLLFILSLFVAGAQLTAAEQSAPGVSNEDLNKFQQRLFDALTKHLDHLTSPEGKAVDMKGKSAAAETALAFYLMGERTGTSRDRAAAVDLADGVLREMRATKLGVLPIKEKETPEGTEIMGGGPPALGEYLAALAYIYHHEQGREEDLKYLGTVLDQFAWNENGWWAADVDIATGQSKAPLAKPSPINKNASLVLAAGLLGEYLHKIDPELAKRLKAKSDKCLYQKILPAQGGDGFWHYSLVGKDPGNKDILGYFMLTTQFLAELQFFVAPIHDNRLSAALENAGAFAAKHIVPITGANHEAPDSGHTTSKTPAHYDLAEDTKRGFQLGLVLTAGHRFPASMQVIDATLPHFPTGNAGQDGAHAALPSALILQMQP